MNKEFFKRKNIAEDMYKVKYKYCDWSLESDVCLAIYTNGKYFLWVVGYDDMILENKSTVIDILRKARKENKLVPKGLIKQLKNLS